MKNRKKIKKPPKWFYLILVIIPILLVLVLEFILQSINYGNDYSTFVKISDDFVEYKFINPKLPRKYFGNVARVPSVIPDGFEKVKDKNTFRIFALGGSTTAGFPHPPNGAFPRLFKKLLQKEYPHIKFEVINLGISAINSVTIKDIIDDVLIEEPDLILIYAGHNEYYGALGAASNGGGVYNTFLTNLILSIKTFKTVQLVENVVQGILLALSEKSDNKATLMSEMAGKKLVALDSEEYENGIKQFESNLSYILSECKNENVPTLIGTLASNLMQEPLCKLSGCDSLTAEFNNLVKNLGTSSKEKLYAVKDLDKLRFRAPEVFNENIKNLAKEFDCKIFDVQKIFEDVSNYGVINEKLMLDHLHPTFDGNLMIAELLLKIFKDNHLIDVIPKEKDDFIRRDVNKYITYSTLDSSYASLRIKYLKNDFPFKNKSALEKIPLSTYEDSLSFDIINGEISWENAHILLAKKYLKRGNLKMYTNEMNILIEDKPFDKYAFLETIKTLENSGNKKYLVDILIKYFENHPNFYTAKKLGEIFNSIRNYTPALYFYNACLRFSEKDPEIHFILSSIYYNRKDLSNAIKHISRCLSIDPNYPNANKVYNSLSKNYKTN